LLEEAGEFVADCREKVVDLCRRQLVHIEAVPFTRERLCQFQTPEVDPGVDAGADPLGEPRSRIHRRRAGVGAVGGDDPVGEGCQGRDLVGMKLRVGHTAPL